MLRGGGGQPVGVAGDGAMDAQLSSLLGGWASSCRALRPRAAALTGQPISWPNAGMHVQPRPSHVTNSREARATTDNCLTVLGPWGYRATGRETCAKMRRTAHTCMPARAPSPGASRARSAQERLKVRPLMVFFSTLSFSGIARLSTCSQLDARRRMRVCTCDLVACT